MQSESGRIHVRELRVVLEERETGFRPMEDGVFKICYH